MNDNTDPLVALAKLLAVYFGVAAAEIIAPQLGVFLAGCAGGVFGLTGWRKCSRLEAIGYVAGCGLLAWLFASLLTRLAGTAWPGLAEVNGITQGSALVIGAVGHRWPGVIKWAGRLIKSAVETAISKERQ